MFSNKNGFTFLEVMISLSLIVILMALAFPSYRNWQQRSQRDRVMHQLYHAIFLARMEAVRHHARMILCGSADGYHCDAQWSRGYILIRQGQLRNIIKWFPADVKQGELHWKGFPRRPSIRFLPSGLTDSQNGTFLYCPSDGDNHFAKALFLIQTGRVRLSTDQNGDGVDEDSSGRPLDCSR